MANGETASDIHLEILRKCGEKDDGTSDFHSQALSYLNKCYQKIISGASEFELDIGEPWYWAQSANPIFLKLLPWIGTGNNTALTVNLTFNSASGSFSAAPQQNGSNISVQGWWMQTTASSEWYQITSHTSGQTAFTLDTVFNDASLTSSSFMMCLLDYTLTAAGQIATPQTEPGGIQRLAAPMEITRQQSFDNDNEYQIYGIDFRELKMEYPMALLELGIPTRFSITSQSNSGVLTVKFNKYVDVQTRVEVRYIPSPLDLTSSPESTPVIPREFRDVLVYGPSYWLCTDKNDSRAADYLQRTQNILKAMIQDARKKRDHIQKQKACLIPRWDLVNQKKRIVYT